MSAKFEGAQVYRELVKFINSVSGKITSKSAILYTGSVSGVAAYKRIERMQSRLKDDYGIQSTAPIEMLPDVLKRIRAPSKMNASRKYSSLLDVLTYGTKSGDLTKAESKDLWSICSAYFAKNAAVIALVSGNDIKLHSDFRDVELAVLHFQKNLKPEVRRKVSKLLREKRKVDKEIADIDIEFHRLLLKSEKALGKKRLKMQHSKMWH